MTNRALDTPVVARPASPVRRPWWDRHGRPPWVPRVLAIGDALGDLALILLVTLVLVGGPGSAVLAATFAAATLLTGTLRGLYRPDPHLSPFDRGLILVEVMVVALAAAIVGVEVAGSPVGFPAIVGPWLAVVATLLVRRWVVNALDVLAWRRGIGVARVLFVGAEGESGRRLMQAVVNDPRLGSHFVGYVSADDRDGPVPVATEHGTVQAPRLGGLGDIASAARAARADEVIIVQSGDGAGDLGRTVADCRAAGLVVRVAPSLEPGTGRGRLTELAGVPVIAFDHAVMSTRGGIAKRVIDVAAAVAILALAVLPMAAIALLIRLDSPGPVLLRQRRVGRDGQEFDVLKFRTMVRDADRLRDDVIAASDAADRRLFKQADDPRLTRVGRWLRRWSLDESPQVWNVLRGEMSLVGPRPPLPEEVALYEPAHMQRLAAVPGLTGLWQVNGRSDLSFDEMVRLDLYYVETWSPWLDLKLMVRTIPAVIGGRGAY